MLGKAQQRESNALSIESRESSSEEEDEVFFGPLTATELSGMKRVRSTQLLTLTAALKIQALCRGHLARRDYRKQRDDLRLLAMKGEFSVERRRRWVNVARPEEPPVVPSVKRGGFRNWFHRSPPPPPPSVEAKVTIGCETLECVEQSRGVARKCLGRLMGSLRQGPPALRRTQSLRRRLPAAGVGRGAMRSPTSSFSNARGRLSAASALAVHHRPLEVVPPPVPLLPNYTTNPLPPPATTTCPTSSSVLVLVPLSDDEQPAIGSHEKHRREPSEPKPATPKKMALFKSGFGSLLSKSPPSKPPVPGYSLTPNIRALDAFPTVRSRAVESMNVGAFVARDSDVASLPCIPRLASAPVVNRVSPVCMSVDNARAYKPDTPSPIVASPPPPPPPPLPIVAAPPIMSPVLGDSSLPPPPPPPPPLTPPPLVAQSDSPRSDTDDDSGIAASVTRLAAQPTSGTSHLSPRLSLRLSVDGAGLFSGPAALGLSAFVAPLAPSPEEEKEGEEEKKPESDDGPVSARLRSLRPRKLASAQGDADGRRFRATQNANRKNAEGGKPLAKMGNLQLDRLTKLNTRRNATYMACRIERFTVIREGDRPPSPSSAMLARAKERMSMEISDDDDDDDDDDDVRPLSPLFSSEDEEGGGAGDAKRKSTDSVSPALGSAGEGRCMLIKKVCRRPLRVQWGSRSVLRDARQAERGALVEGAPKPILVNKCESPKTIEGPSDFCVVRVACIEYPSHIPSDEDENEDENEDEDEEEGEEEYVPRRSAGRRKKVV